jgi:hypothetical protein
VIVNRYGQLLARLQFPWFVLCLSIAVIMSTNTIVTSEHGQAGRDEGTGCEEFRVSKQRGRAFPPSRTSWEGIDSSSFLAPGGVNLAVWATSPA